jgi:cardiolipin synthase
VANTEESKEIRPAFFALLDSAREHVVIEHAYLSDPEVIDRLVAVSKRGVRVTIVIPQRMQLHNHATQLGIGRLMSEGDLANVRVFVFPGYCHSKIVLVDSFTAFLGSANLYKGSLDDMGEVNVLIKGRFRALWTLKEMLRHDVLVSKPLSSPPGFLWLSRWLSWLGL